MIVAAHPAVHGRRSANLPGTAPLSMSNQGSRLPSSFHGNVHGGGVRCHDRGHALAADLILSLVEPLLRLPCCPSAFPIITTTSPCGCLAMPPTLTAVRPVVTLAAAAVFVFLFIFGFWTWGSSSSSYSQSSK